MKKLLLFVLCPLWLFAQGNLENGSPNYPKLEPSTNVQKDHDNWNEAKTNWIKNHPEEYRAMGGDPEIINSKKESTGDNLTITPETFVAHTSYTLTDLAVVPNGDYIPKSNEVEEQLKTLQKDYTVGKTQLQFANESIFRLYEVDKIDIRGVEKRSSVVVEWVFDNKDCPQCSKTLVLTLEQNTNNKKVYLMKNEDEESSFSYRLTFETH